ncbi:MAG: hypothetical protein LAP87_27660 [Acidobacteriia bacterium]|nr:hypothetical protein [Terriglobia bacterium]MBZ5728744.1 hypothetical protein [Terriglobia bacterium]
MALVDLTKQLAQQAILSATKEPPPPPPAGVGAVILAQIGAMQKALKDDEELIVLFQNAGERLRVMEIFLAAPQVAVLSGMDANRVLTRVISPVETLELVTKTVKVQPGAKPARVNLVTQKPKDSNAR